MKTQTKISTTFHGIDTNKRLTKVFRESLRSSWLHIYIRLKRFVRDYSLPVSVTAAFLILLVGVSIVRASSRASLADLLAGVSSVREGYGTLESKDTVEELQRNNDPNQPLSQTPAGTPSSFAINASPGVTIASSTQSNPGTTQPPEPPLTFSASIGSFQYIGVTLECSNPKPKQQTCSKRYTFNASIRTQNGPGSVTYGWRSNLAAAVADGSFIVSAGLISTPLQKEIVLACTVPTSFSLQLAITSPTSTQSNTINTSHNCNEL